jgi:hypothetical protein
MSCGNSGAAAGAAGAAGAAEAAEAAGAAGAAGAAANKEPWYGRAQQARGHQRLGSPAFISSSTLVVSRLDRVSFSTYKQLAKKTS